MQCCAFEDDSLAASRQRRNNSGRRDDAPPGHPADVSCRTRLIDAGITDADPGRPDASSSSPYAGLIDTWVARLQRTRQGGKRRANDQYVETCEMINKAKENDYITAVSHRSGETTDDFISDLAVASQSEFIKLGAPARGERVAKFNRLLEMKDSLKG